VLRPQLTCCGWRAQLPSGRPQAVPYALTVGPPLVLALSFPDLFFRALDVAGTYGRAAPLSLADTG